MIDGCNFVPKVFKPSKFYFIFYLNITADMNFQYLSLHFVVVAFGTSCNQKSAVLCLTKSQKTTRQYRLSKSLKKKIPRGHITLNDVVLTSMQCDDVASTLIRRHFGTKCPLDDVLASLALETRSRWEQWGVTDLRKEFAPSESIFCLKTLIKVFWFMIFKQRSRRGHHHNLDTFLIPH